MKRLIINWLQFNISLQKLTSLTLAVEVSFSRETGGIAYNAPYMLRTFTIKYTT